MLLCSVTVVTSRSLEGPNGGGDGPGGGGQGPTAAGSSTDLDTIAAVLHFQGTAAQKRSQAEQFAELAYGAYEESSTGIDPRVRSSNAQQRKKNMYHDPPTLGKLPYERAFQIKEKYGKAVAHPLVPVVWQRHHWEARAIDANRRRFAELRDVPPTKKSLEFWTPARLAAEGRKGSAKVRGTFWQAPNKEKKHKDGPSAPD